MNLENIHISDSKSILEMGMWYRYYHFKTERSRNELVEFYLPIVKSISGYIFYKRAANDLPFEDYYQYGVVGLLKAIDRFQLDGRAAFATYATYRIKGEIYSGLATLTEKRAQSEFRKRLLNERINTLVIKDGAKGNFEELLNLTISVALGYLIQGTYDNEGFIKSDDFPYNSNVITQVTERLSTAVETLPEKEYLVIK